MKRMSEALCQLFNLPFLLHPSHCWLCIHLQRLFLKQSISESVFQLRVPGPYEAGASPSQMDKRCSLLETLSTLQPADIFLMKRRRWKMQTAIKTRQVQSFRGQTLQGLMLVQLFWISYCPWTALLQHWSQSHEHWGTLSTKDLVSQDRNERSHRETTWQLLLHLGWNPTCLHTYKGRSVPFHLGHREPFHPVNRGTLHCLSYIKHLSA